MLSEMQKDSFYITHLSYNGRERERLWNYAKENNLIGLDAPSIVTDNWVKVRESARKLLPNIWVRQFDIFCNEMKMGDIVLALNGWDSLLGIAEIAEIHHRYDRKLSENENFFDHVRQVKWIRKYEYANRHPIPEPIRGFNNTLSKVTPNTQRWSILTSLDV